MNLLDLVKLSPLMARGRGSPELKIGLIDGPVAIEHPDFESEHLRAISANSKATCTRTNSAACLHGTFVAGILSAKRGSPAPAICPDCTLLDTARVRRDDLGPRIHAERNAPRTRDGDHSTVSTRARA